jgi:non-specific serine/threonine protein kinase/serine/threonine-protein kinase
MGTHDLPHNPEAPSDSGDADGTLSTGGSGGAAAGQIGPYRMLQLLGGGGMGEVWLAEQKTPIHRTVALKLIKAGMDTKAVIARFESERQALALMDHPGIARVFDAGSTPEGRPYFAMEYVPGLPITEYCDKHRLTVKERLELFMQVCDGVQHAHQKAIIHRDLKPSNVLVMEQVGKAVPKIIDFGLAKATAQRLTDKTMFTELGAMMGTPEYMSPEQADQREQNIDTRTDVYSLGVILYQLLVGVLPFEAKSLRAEGLDAILRVIREQEPDKPSTRIRSMGPATNLSAENRREDPHTFARRIRGELDWITMKALEKDRTRRYGSAAALSEDIKRHLGNEPVTAHPPSPGYRAGKFIRRHRLAVGFAASMAVLLVAFAAMMAVQAVRVSRERDRAKRITDFMKGMFLVSDPSEARGNSITAREILDKASEEIETGLANDPELRAQLMDVMGGVYQSLGLYSRAQQLFEQAVNIDRRAVGPKNPETLRTKSDMAWLLSLEGNFTEAERLLRETLEAQRQVLGGEHPDTLTSMRHLGAILLDEGHYAEAEKLNRELLDTERRVLGPEHRDTLATIHNLALDLDFERHYAEAEKLDRELLNVKARLLGAEHPDTLMTKNNLASTLQHEGRYAEAEKLYREVLDIDRRVLGPEHPRTLVAISNLALALQVEGHYAEAERLGREVLEVQSRVLGPEHPNTLLTVGTLALTLGLEERYTEAEKLYRELLDANRRVLGPEHPDTLIAEYNLACVVAHQGRSDQALSLLRDAVDHGLPPAADLGIDKDPDLKSLYGDPRFDALVSHAKELAQAKTAAAAQQKPN